jgi:hypothetical protein
MNLPKSVERNPVIHIQIPHDHIWSKKTWRPFTYAGSTVHLNGTFWAKSPPVHPGSAENAAPSLARKVTV